MNIIYVKLGDGTEHYENVRLGIRMTLNIPIAAANYDDMDPGMMEALNASTIVQISYQEFFAKAAEIVIIPPNVIDSNYLLTLSNYITGCPLDGDAFFILRGPIFYKVSWNDMKACFTTAPATPSLDQVLTVGNDSFNSILLKNAAGSGTYLELNGNAGEHGIPFVHMNAQDNGSGFETYYHAGGMTFGPPLPGVSGDQIQFPNFLTGIYTLPITVNGIAADTAGNITVPTSSGTPTLDAVLLSGNQTMQDMQFNTAPDLPTGVGFIKMHSTDSSGEPYIQITSHIGTSDFEVKHTAYGFAFDNLGLGTAKIQFPYPMPIGTFNLPLSVNGVPANTQGNIVLPVGPTYTAGPGIEIVSNTIKISDVKTTPGKRVIWNPAEAAFRAGETSGTQWNIANIGTNSIGLGYDVIASGTRAISIGDANFSYGTQSVTLGTANTVNPAQSWAIGQNNVISGFGSATAVGFNNTVSGWQASAFGANLQSKSYGGTVVGFDNDRTNAANANAWNAANRVFQVGIGNAGAVHENALTILFSGKTTLNKYGVGNFIAGTVAYNLGVDASGNIMEVATGGGSGVYLPLAGGTMTGNLLTNTTSKIGINNLAPVEPLSINADGNSIGFYDAAGNQQAFFIGGVGTLTRQMLLSSPGVTGTNGVADSFLGFRFGAAGNKIYFGNDGTVSFMQTNHPIQFTVGPSGGHPRTDAVPHMTLNTTGLGIGITAPLVPLHIVRNSLGAAAPQANTSDTILLQNTTPATVALNQTSPSIHWTGTTWETTGGTSQQVDWWQFINPVSGATPTSELRWVSGNNNTSIVTAMVLSSTGRLTVVDGLISSGGSGAIIIRPALGAAVFDGVTISNTTAAAAGSQVQSAPGLMFSGTAWDGSASRTINWRWNAMPIGGTNPVTSYIALSSQINAGGYNERLRVTDAGFVGIGTGSPVSARVHVLGNSEQLRLGFDAANYASFVVNSTGSVTATLSGSALGWIWLDIMRFNGGFSASTWNAPLGTISINLRENIATGMNINGNGVTTMTSGFRNSIVFADSFSPPSGTATFNGLILSHTINQTGGANGITRGIYLLPTLTAVFDWRSIEIANNVGYGIYQSGASALNYFAGNVGIGQATPTAYLHLKAGTTAANTAPIKLTAGTRMTTPQPGTIEYETGRFIMQSDTLEINKNALDVTTADGLLIANNTAAAAGAQQYSPALTFSSNGWGTTAGTSQNITWRSYATTAQGPIPSGALVLGAYSVAGGAYSARLSITTTGVLVMVGGITASGYLQLNSSIIGATSTDGLMVLNSTAATSGVPVQMSPRLRFSSSAWSGAASQLAEWIMETVPVNGTNPITSYLKLSSQIAGGGYNERLRVTDAGNMGIGGAPATSALLDLTSTTKAFKLMVMTKAQRDAIPTPQAGFAVFQSDNTPGLRVHNGTNWMKYTETAD